MCFELIMQLISVPPPDPLPHLRFRLMPDAHDRMNHWTGRNLFEKWSRHRYEFWHGTGETPETFLQILRKVNNAMTSDDK